MVQNNAVEIKGLSVNYDNTIILDDINLCIPSSKLIAIVGPNGAGKSTLVKSMINLVKKNSGSIHYIGFDYLKYRNKIAYVPQSNSVDWDFPTTVLDVVLMGRYGHLGLFKRIKQSDKLLALEMLNKVGMDSFANRPISKLSGGQQQRVFLARALVQEADIYIFDEPFKGVDIKSEKVIINLLIQLKKDNKTVIVVHHDLSTVKEYFDDVVLLNVTVIDSGLVKDVFTDKNIQKTYGASNLVNTGYSNV